MLFLLCFFFFFKQKTAYEIMPSLVGSEMCIRDSYFSLNVIANAAGVSLLRGVEFRRVLLGDSKAYVANTFALAPLAWLMAQVYALPGGWWATLLFGLPLYTTRLSSHRFVEMREMFTQTIGALAEAVDKRDPFTSRHSRRVMEIARDIGREMRLGDADLEALE